MELLSDIEIILSIFPKILIFLKIFYQTYYRIRLLKYKVQIFIARIKYLTYCKHSSYYTIRVGSLNLPKNCGVFKRHAISAL